MVILISSTSPVPIEFLRAIETFEGDNLDKITGIPNVKNNMNH